MSCGGWGRKSWRQDAAAITIMLRNVVKYNEGGSLHQHQNGMVPKGVGVDDAVILIVQLYMSVKLQLVMFAV